MQEAHNKDTEIEALSRQIEKQKIEIKEHGNNVATLTKDLKDVRSRSSLDRQIMEDKHETAQQQLHERRKDFEQVKEELQIQLNELKEEREALWSELQESTTSNQSLNIKNEELVLEMSKISAESAALSETLSLTRTVNQRLKKEIDCLSMERDELKSDLIRYEGDLKEANYQKRTATVTCD